MKIFISDAIGAERIPFVSQSPFSYGKAHYSWKIISKMYHDALIQSQFKVQKVTAPDVYQSSCAKRIFNISANDIHVAIKPSEFIRPMFGVKNFFVCGWEFPQFVANYSDNSEGHNQIAIFSRADTVVCWSQFTADNLKRHGIDHAVALPPPVVDLMPVVPAPIDSVQCFHHDQNGAHGLAQISIESVRNNYDEVIISVLNPWDARKNISSLITAFNAFSLQSSSSTALIIKLIVDNVGTFANNFPEILRERYGISEISKDVFFFGDQLTGAQMRSFYKLADFYLSASSAEGLNLPLIEAMSSGVLPISSNATAMGDYISKRNAVVMPTKSAIAGSAFSSVGDAIEISHFPPSADAIVNALHEATSLGAKQRAAKVELAKSKVSERYGFQRFNRDFVGIIGG